MQAFDVIIYHNPRCSTSRDVLDMIRANGIEPHIIEYLKTPPTALILNLLAKRSDMELRDFIRTKEEAYNKFGLDDLTLNDEQISALMHQHPELINRPIVVSPNGVKLCRPATSVNELLVQD